jgi:lipid-binding SYLF domain-containing protein
LRSGIPPRYGQGLKSALTPVPVLTPLFPLAYYEESMNQVWTVLGGSLLLLFCFGECPHQRAQASWGGQEEATMQSAGEVLQAFAELKLKGIPPAMLQDAQGVAIIPNVIKAGFVFGGRFGRGVVLTREPDGSWTNPVFINLAGGGVGWQIGVQSTDLILVFKTRNGLDRILDGKGKLTLGADVSVAIGPIGRQAGAATDGMLKAEIYSYSRSRGLFAGLSAEGAGIMIDFDANKSYYYGSSGQPADIMANKVLPTPGSAKNLKIQLERMSSPMLFDPMTAPPLAAPVGR